MPTLCSLLNANKFHAIEVGQVKNSDLSRKVFLTMPHKGNLTLNGRDLIQSQGLKVPLQCSCELALQYEKCTLI